MQQDFYYICAHTQLLMKRLTTIFLAALLPLTMQAQFSYDGNVYDIDSYDIERAQKLIDTPLKKPLAFPNPRTGAQWYPDASLGLFMHWGIHSVIGAQPSWAMINHYKWNGGYCSPDKYYALTGQFNPQNYNPDKYLKAAKEAGFNYAVLTSRHHDGYALWPSKYGISTRQYMGGRDLIKEYVDACRRNGLKVGLYYSPNDWHYPGAKRAVDFDDNTKNEPWVIADSTANYHEYVKFLGYVMAQIEELLTRYGKIDILWLDGISWNGINDMHTEQIYSWIRSLQPDIVINDRWSNVTDPDNPSGKGIRLGDFTTPFECITPDYSPSKWWEHCHIWTYGGGGWGYCKSGKFRPMRWFFSEFVASRSFGGNFLINVGPDPNGNMHPNFYGKIDSLKIWMANCKESLVGAGPTPGERLSNVMLTTRGTKIWYAHILPGSQSNVHLMTGVIPKSVINLNSGKEIKYSYISGSIYFTLPKNMRGNMDDIVKIVFK